MLTVATCCSWLVTRDMADQDLLPLPSSVPVDPDTEWSSSAATEIRGTLTWAPPRPQIVLTVVLLSVTK